MVKFLCPLTRLRSSLYVNNQSKSKCTSNPFDLEPQIKILFVWRTVENIVKYFIIAAPLISSCCFKKYNVKI